MDYEGERLAGRTIDLDGNSFRRCWFEDAIVRIGGAPFHMVDCHFGTGVTWELVGNLAVGIEVLRRLHTDPARRAAVADAVRELIVGDGPKRFTA